MGDNGHPQEQTFDEWADDLSSFGTKVASRTLHKSGEGICSEEPEMEMSVSKPVQWAIASDTEYHPCMATRNILPPGAYTITWDGRKDVPAFHKSDLKVDKLIRFPAGSVNQILLEITEFWGLREEFLRYGYLHRRGYLLYGPQGSGKSCLVQQVIADIVERGGVALICQNPSISTKALVEFRKIEPNRKVVCLFEDIDSIIDKYGEKELLALLDGESQIDYVLNIATTNYPEKLDPRIVARPRRFDRVRMIGMPVEETRRIYFKTKLEKTDDIEMWVKATQGLSFAALAECVISVKCLKNSVEETLKILRKMSQNKASSREYFTEPVGFATAKNNEKAEE